MQGANIVLHLNRYMANWADDSLVHTVVLTKQPYNKREKSGIARLFKARLVLILHVLTQ